MLTESEILELVIDAANKCKNCVDIKEYELSQKYINKMSAYVEVLCGEDKYDKIKDKIHEAYTNNLLEGLSGGSHNTDSNK